ncbi:PREDICTED: aminopeptidase Ey-like isoform X2 [Branchiostoma belcheri]|uniref:Aminopeptidase n=1 Tax=Branchiostoma belcheri TaxID=7741 RepID=A0A6P4YER3_BRABE|nr:PREDICTED: aminopeptidase Ey-like isoform X2 [Branchiostoma belcheri]
MENSTDKTTSRQPKKSKRLLILLAAVILFVLVAVAVTVALLVSRAEQDTPSGDPWLGSRLPSSLVPVHYQIELQPNLDTFTFIGSEHITIQCLESTDYILLNSRLLNITDGSVSLLTARGETVDVKRWFLYPENEFFVVQAAQILQRGENYVLSVSFSGVLRDDLRGFYRSSYLDHLTGETRHLATTQFSAIDARKAFPCFDEPAMKATFHVTLVHQSEYTALSNMPIRQSEMRQDGWTADHFDTTVRMSSYLVAFVISNFTYRENVTGLHGNITLKVWARPDAVANGEVDYAIAVASKVLTYYEEYFGIPFPLPKLDMAAIPDFPFGAMENWGLITYRETALLYDPAVSTEANKQRVAVVVAHELGHQWFGNLVTPAWWEDLWLKEGFASTAEYPGVDFVEPTWAMEDQFLIADLHPVFALDSLSTSHPISLPVNHPDEISQIFDTISYSKGASIIRMMSSFLGSSYTKGIKSYLERYQFANAVQDDLWNSLTEAAQEDGRTDVQVKEVMDTWTLQMGFPVVTVTRDYSNGRVTATQRHFLYDPEVNVPESPYNYVWQVPLTYTTEEDMNFADPPRTWIRDRTEEFPVSVAPTSWLIANVNQTGYFRVNYDITNWGLLTNFLNSDNFQDIPVATRSSLIDDAFNIAQSGGLSSVIALDLSRYLEREREYLPWASASGAFGYISRMMAGTDSSQHLERYVLNLALPLYNRLGWEDTGGHLERYNRMTILSMACNFGYNGCLQNASQKFSEWKAGRSVSPNLKGVVYCYGIANGNEDDWNFAWQKYLSTDTVASEKALLLSALACTADQYVLSRYLDWTIDSTKVRKADALNTIVAISGNKLGKMMVWNFLNQNWGYIFDSYGGSLFGLTGLILGVTEDFNTEEELQQMQEFVSSHPELGTATRAIQQAQERARVNIKWRQQSEDDVAQWLADHQREGQTL